MTVGVGGKSAPLALTVRKYKIFDLLKIHFWTETVFLDQNFLKIDTLDVLGDEMTSILKTILTTNPNNTS